MDNLQIMEVSNSVNYWPENPLSLILSIVGLLYDSIEQLAPSHELQHEILPVFPLVDFIQLDDVRMIYLPT